MILYYRKILSYTCLIYIYLCRNTFACDESDYPTAVWTEKDTLKKFGVFYDTDEFLRPSSSQILNTTVSHWVGLYKKHCLDYKNTRKSKNAHLFIVVESRYKSVRMMLTRLLANKIGAKFLNNPPSYLRYVETPRPYLRRIFFTIGNFAASCDAREYVKKSPVIMYGSWLYQSSYIITRTFLEKAPLLPPEVYKLPKMLYKPDVLFFLDPFKMESEFVNALIDNLGRWEGVTVFCLNTSKPFKVLIDEAISNLNSKFHTDFENAPHEQDIFN